jgi:hypothetical protein
MVGAGQTAMGKKGRYWPPTKSGGATTNGGLDQQMSERLCSWL